MPTDRPVNLVERILYLKQLEVIGTLPASDLGVVAEYTRERFFPKGSLLMREGEPPSAIYFVVDGRAHLSRRGRTLGHAGPGSPAGALPFLARDPQGVSIVAETDLLTLEWDTDAVLELFEDHFPILHHVLRMICRQLIALARNTTDSSAVFSLDPVPAPGRELDLVERIFILRRSPPFRRSSINALAELSRGMTEVHFDEGVTLWHRGERGSSLFLLVSGTVSCRISDAVSFRLGPGFPMGGLEAVAEGPRWYEAVTETPVVALHADAEGLIDVFEDNFDMAMDYLAMMSRFLLDAMERIGADAKGAVGRFYECADPSAHPPVEAAEARPGGPPA